jgi:hypothetical protein
MSNFWPLFTFLAAAAIGLFAFISVAAWADARSARDQARDRYALLRTLAEQPGENARLVLEMLRGQEERKARRKDEDERRGFMIGSLVCMATGISLIVMFVSLGSVKAWPVGLIPLLIGVVLAPFGLPRKGTRRPEGLGE